jgi:hypothetical protein
VPCVFCSQNTCFQLDELADIIEVKECLARRLVFLPGQVRKLVESVEVVVIGAAACPPSRKEPVLPCANCRVLADADTGIARCGKERREPVEPRDNIVRDRSRLDKAWPADHRRHTEGAFPIGVLLAAEWRHGSVRPRIHMRTVIRRIENDGVVRDPEIIEGLEQLADIVVMFEHSIEIFADATAALHRWPHMCVEVHAGTVLPQKKGFFAFT